LILSGLFVGRLSHLAVAGAMLVGFGVSPSGDPYRSLSLPIGRRGGSIDDRGSTRRGLSTTVVKSIDS
jgi:hypothetical protein